MENYPKNKRQKTIRKKGQKTIRKIGQKTILKKDRKLSFAHGQGYDQMLYYSGKKLFLLSIDKKRKFIEIIKENFFHMFSLSLNKYVLRSFLFILTRNGEPQTASERRRYFPVPQVFILLFLSDLKLECIQTEPEPTQTSGSL